MPFLYLMDSLQLPVDLDCNVLLLKNQQHLQLTRVMLEETHLLVYQFYVSKMVGTLHFISQLLYQNFSSIVPQLTYAYCILLYSMSGKLSSSKKHYVPDISPF